MDRKSRIIDIALTLPKDRWYLFDSTKCTPKEVFPPLTVPKPFDYHIYTGTNRMGMMRMLIVQDTIHKNCIHSDDPPHLWTYDDVKFWCTLVHIEPPSEPISGYELFIFPDLNVPKRNQLLELYVDTLSNLPSFNVSF